MSLYLHCGSSVGLTMYVYSYALKLKYVFFCFPSRIPMLAYEFGGGDGNAEDAANAHDSKMQGQQKLPALEKFKGQETTR